MTLRELGIYYINSNSLTPDEILSKLGRNNPALIVLPSCTALDLMTDFNLKPPRAFAPNSKTEYVAASHINNSNSLRKRSEWADSALMPEDKLSKIGKERIAPLLRVSSRISLVDRYAFPTFLSNGDDSGLSWFLNQLDHSVKKTCKISIFSTYSPDRKTSKPPIDTDIWVDRIQNRLENVNGELNVHLGPDYLYREKAHDRYLRVNDRRVIDIGKGVDAFSGWRIKQRSSFNYSALKRSKDIDYYRRFEDDLRRPDTIHTFVRVLGEGF
jgi:hypothetical protein